jgi:hypothetical protein
LQNKALIARKNGDMSGYRLHVRKIQDLLTEAAAARMQRAARDKSSWLFHKWASAIIKPCRSEQGKFVMVNKSIDEITSTINSNYISPNTEDLNLRTQFPFTQEDVDSVRRTLEKSFSFEKNIASLTKVPTYFKKCSSSSTQIAKSLVDATCTAALYPKCLKNSKCDILPDRSIFQNIKAHAKVAEGYFATYISQKYATGLENMAYRQKLSTTALLINEFDTLARFETLYGFNADLQKAFDRLCRDLVLDAIENNFMKNIVASWMDRTDCPYLIYWRGRGHLIQRDDWSRGVEPGSVLGPILFIVGLDDRVLFKKCVLKNIFADDSFPLYKSLADMNSDAADFINRIYKHQMEIHISGDKKLTFSAFGKGVSKAPENIFIECDIGDVACAKKQINIKQVGLEFSIDQNGIPICDMLAKISRLREAGHALRRISRNCLSSTAVHLVKTYIVSVIAYAICIWYPNMYFYKNKTDKGMREAAVVEARNRDPSKNVSINTRLKCTGALEELRYYYLCVLNYVCFESLDLMGWTNSTRSVSENTSLESKLCALTGMPTLEELYISSCQTHYGHFVNMYEMGVGCLKGKGPGNLPPVLNYNQRVKRLLYVGSTVRGRVSPLKLLVQNVNSMGKEGRALKVSPDFTDSLLLNFEIDYAIECRKGGKSLDKSFIRNMQRILSLAYFGKLNVGDEVNKRMAIDDIIFWEARASAIKSHVSRFRKKARLTPLVANEAYPGRSCQFKPTTAEIFTSFSSQGSDRAPREAVFFFFRKNEYAFFFVFSHISRPQSSI